MLVVLHNSYSYPHQRERTLFPVTASARDKFIGMIRLIAVSHRITHAPTIARHICLSSKFFLFTRPYAFISRLNSKAADNFKHTLLWTECGGHDEHSPT